MSSEKTASAAAARQVPQRAETNPLDAVPEKIPFDIRAAATFRRETKVFEDAVNLMHLNYVLAFDGVIASRGGIPSRRTPKVLQL